MKYPWIDQYLMQKKGVTKDLKLEWNWLRYQIGGKLFCAICLDPQNKPYYITLKLRPLDGQMLREQYADILPGYYCNKEHWNSIRPDGQVPDDLMKRMLDQAYELVFQGLPKRVQREIGENA